MALSSPKKFPKKLFILYLCAESADTRFETACFRNKTRNFLLNFIIKTKLWYLTKILAL